MSKQDGYDPTCKSFPICSLEELKKLKLVTNQSKLQPKEQRCFTAVNAKFKDEISKNVPRTLVCHDMKGKSVLSNTYTFDLQNVFILSFHISIGGYLDDRCRKLQ